MLNATLLPLTNDNVRVRPMTHADAAAYAEGTHDDAVRTYAHLPAPEYSPELVVEMIDGVIGEGLAKGELAVLSIAEVESDRFLGSIVLFDVTATAAEVGFWLHPDARGRGLTSTALALATRFAQESGLSLLTARTIVDNVASQHVLAKAGFVPVRRDRGTAPSGLEVELIHYECVLPPNPDNVDRSGGSVERA